MVDFNKARELAVACWDEVDYCTEHTDAFVFSKFGDMSFGGNGPVVVLKASGRCINMVDYLNMDGDNPVVREGYLGDFA